MGTGAQVYLGSAQLGAITAMLGELPSLDTYRKEIARLEKAGPQIYRPLQHA